MSYYDAIANAIGARGNALAQGALQSGQVWGNLAANLGQIPGQAIAFHQQRQDALQNHELKKMALEKAQRTAGMEKEMIRIVNSGLPDEQIITELERVGSADPDVFLKIQNLKSQFLTRQQQVLHQQKMEESQMFRDQLAFQGAQKGGSGVPVSMPTPTGPDLSRGNALSPIVPLAQPNIPEVRMNPSMQTKFGIIPGQPTAEEQLVQKKDLAAFTAELRAKTFATQTRPDKDPTSSTGWTLKLFNRETGQYDIPTGLESPPPMSTLPGAGQPQSQAMGFNQEGKLVSFLPEKGGPGSVQVAKGADQGPLNPKVSQPLPDNVVRGLASTINSLQLIKQMEDLIPQTHSDIPVWSNVKGVGQRLGVAAGVAGPEQQFTDVTNKLKLGAQEIIKGTPSNFDVQTFISTLPALGQGSAQAKNLTKLAKEQLVNSLTTQIANMKAKNQIVPEEILESARSVGINVGGGAPGGGGGGNITPEAAAAELARRKQAKAGKK